jgi:hypothetical protein
MPGPLNSPMLLSGSFSVGCQKHTLEKRRYLQQTLLCKLDALMQKNEIRPASPCTTDTTKSKQTKDLSVKCETQTLLEENTNTTVHDLSVCRKGRSE